MGRFLRTVLAQDETVVASSVVTYDLPVNPMSHILLTLKSLNSTGTITDYTYLTSLLNSIASVEVLLNGSAIVSLSFFDLAILAAKYARAMFGVLNSDAVTGYARAVTVPIPFGRKLFDVDECFPRTTRGQFQLKITYAAAQTGLVTPVIQIETVELPEAAPRSFLKYTGLTKTPTTTGFHEVDLPIGNDILGVLLFSTTVPASASYNASIGQVNLRIDNTDDYYGLTNWETLHNEMLADMPMPHVNHVHSYNAAAVATEYNTREPKLLNNIIEKYAFLDFDPRRDGSFALATEGRSRVNLRINQKPTADAIRVIPIELIRVKAA